MLSWQKRKNAGAKLYEKTQVTAVKRDGSHYSVLTERSKIKAEHVLLATNGYKLGLQHFIEKNIFSIRSYIGATEPLSKDSPILQRGESVDDSRFMVRYFRKSTDNRLLFGGVESYDNQYPANLDERIRRQMIEIYPHLHSIKLTHHWGGRLQSQLSVCLMFANFFRV